MRALLPRGRNRTTTSPAERAVVVPRTVRIERRSVLAFRNERGLSRLRSELLTVGARRFKLVSFCGGPWEVYAIDPRDDFTETFVGYAGDAIRAIARRPS